MSVDDWLSAITSKPECITLRSAFADWLQDKGDDRWEKVAASCVDDGIDRTTDILLEFPLQTSSLSSAYRRRVWSSVSQIDTFLRPILKVDVHSGRWCFDSIKLSSPDTSKVDVWVLTKSDGYYSSLLHRQEVLRGEEVVMWDWNPHHNQNFYYCLKADRPIRVQSRVSAESII